MGALLGSFREDGLISVHECFAIPYSITATSATEEPSVQIDTQHYSAMIRQFRRTDRALRLVGWFSTCPSITEASRIFHGYFEGRTSRRIIHLTVDPTLAEQTLALCAYVSAPVGLPVPLYGSPHAPVEGSNAAPVTSGADQLDTAPEPSHASGSGTAPAVAAIAARPPAGGATESIASNGDASSQQPVAAAPMMTLANMTENEDAGVAESPGVIFQRIKCSIKLSETERAACTNRARGGGGHRRRVQC